MNNYNSYKWFLRKGVYLIRGDANALNVNL